MGGVETTATRICGADMSMNEMLDSLESAVRAVLRERWAAVERNLVVAVADELDVPLSAVHQIVVETTVIDDDLLAKAVPSVASG